MGAGTWVGTSVGTEEGAVAGAQEIKKSIKLIKIGIIVRFFIIFLPLSYSQDLSLFPILKGLPV